MTPIPDSGYPRMVTSFFGRSISFIETQLNQRLLSVPKLTKTFGLAMALATAGLGAGDDIFVASYGGSITRLAFVRSGNSSSLQVVGTTRDCGINPSWLELDRSTSTLFCSNEAAVLPNAGSVASFSIDTATPTIIGNSTSDFGPVSSVIYAPNRIALAHYGGSAVSVFDISNSSKLVELQSFHYTMSKPGPVPDRQDAPHPHQIVSDPTGKFLVSPDLGADLLRIYSVGYDGRLIEQEPFSVLAGSGPRHGAFVKSSDKTFYYILGELTNSLTGYEVTYENSTISFDQICSDSTFQTGFGDGAGYIWPAEMLAPDSTHLVVSIRNDSKSTFEGKPSDTLLSYEIDPESGDLSLISKSSAGGIYPRGIAINANGTLVASTTQFSGRLAIFERDAKTGIISSDALATWTTTDVQDGSSLVHVIWNQ